MVVAEFVGVAVTALILSLAVAENGQYLNSFAVEVHGDLAEAQIVARDLGFEIHQELPNIGVFILKHPEVSHRSKRSSESHVARLKSHPKVRYAQQELELKRVKRNIIHDKQLELPIREIKDNSVFHRVELPSISVRDYQDEVTFNDPFYRDMWYLKNKGQSGGEKYLDMNIQVVWANGFSGEGVVVCILDDGVDHTHPDLVDNYDPMASADLNDKSDIMQDPMPNITIPGNSHGTRCAGEIASKANNNVCGVGVAYNAKIGGVRILDGIVTDSLEGEALMFKKNYIDIFSASWGPNDDGKTMEAPGLFADQALKIGVKKGRGGLGNIFVWATGNGGMNNDDCNADGYTSRIETLSVGSITDRGRQPFYMENCSSTLAVVPTGGEEYKGQELDMGQIKLKVVTTDTEGGCIENFQGTSSAAPLGAGCLANVLQANPYLTWRDVQHIVVRGTRIPSVDSSWTINGGGHHVSHKFGFGLMDCGKMVELAQEWRYVPKQHVCQYSRINPQKLERGGKVFDSIFVDGCKEDASKWIQRLEHVQVRIKLSTRRRGDTNIFLISPSGTRSELLSLRPLDDHIGNWEFTFMTVHSWDENPMGTWLLQIHDKPQNEPEALTQQFASFMKPMDSNVDGYIEEWSLILYGTAGERYSRAFTARQETRRAFHPSQEVVQILKRDETAGAMNVHVKRARTAFMYAKRTGKDYLDSDDKIRKLAAQLLSPKAHQYGKRILSKYHSVSSQRSQRYQYGREKKRNYQSDTHRGEHINKILRDLEHLLAEKNQKEEATSQKQQKESHFIGQKLDPQEDKEVQITERALMELLLSLENAHG